MSKEFNREELLKRRILEQYPTIPQFLRHVGFSSQKIISPVVNRTGEYLYVCDILGLDPYTLDYRNDYESTGVSVIENKLLHSYLTLNMQGRKKIMEIMADLNEMGKYRRKEKTL